MKTIYVFCLLLYAVCTEGADISVDGLEGREVSFRCSHKLAWKHNKYLCKDPCEGNEHVLVTVESGGRAESGRITLVDSGNGVFTVTFSQLQLSDSGKYWCAVDRPGFDTFTAVHLTVKEVVANETMVIPEFSTIWIYKNISNPTQLTPGMDTSRPTNLSMASNATNGGVQNISTGTVLYATIGAAAMLTILLLSACFRKSRRNPKTEPQVCTNSTDLVGADESEADCEYDDIGVEVQSLEKLSKRYSSSHRPKQDPPTSESTAAECSMPTPIYENICCSRVTPCSRCSAANVQDEPNNSSAIYINPLPPTVSETTGDVSLGKHTNKPSAARKNKSHASNASACHSRACSDSTKVRPRSLWFGLDLSGTV